MKIYIAAASRELERAKWWMRTCVGAGHQITHDWTTEIESALQRGLSDAELDELERQLHVTRDLNGVMAADLCWLLAPPNPRDSIGCWAELGCALGRKIERSYPRIYVSGGDQGPLWCAGADKRFTLDHEAFSAIAELDKRLRQKGLDRGV